MGWECHLLVLDIKQGIDLMKVLKGDILCFSVSFNLQMMLQSRTAVLNDAKV